MWDRILIPEMYTVTIHVHATLSASLFQQILLLTQTCNKFIYSGTAMFRIVPNSWLILSFFKCMHSYAKQSASSAFIPVQGIHICILCSKWYIANVPTGYSSSSFSCTNSNEDFMHGEKSEQGRIFQGCICSDLCQHVYLCSASHINPSVQLKNWHLVTVMPYNNSMLFCADDILWSLVRKIMRQITGKIMYVLTALHC